MGWAGWILGNPRTSDEEALPRTSSQTSKVATTNVVNVDDLRPCGELHLALGTDSLEGSEHCSRIKHIQAKAGAVRRTRETMLWRTQLPDIGVTLGQAFSVVRKTGKRSIQSWV